MSSGARARQSAVTAENLASTAASSAPAAMAHSAAPLQAPLQPEKRASLAGSALSNTATSEANEAEHVPGQTMPAGVDVTVPPEPEIVMAIPRSAGRAGVWG